MPEPIREPEPDIVPEPLPEDAVILVGVPAPPSPPAPSGPMLAGVGGVTQPVRIEESYVRPNYPEVARLARIECRVVLQAVIQSDGTVGEISVLSCSQPALGFEEEAIEAVQQWRYRPALEGNRPVDVYFTVLVDFALI
jgi:protein TonB